MEKTSLGLYNRHGTGSLLLWVPMIRVYIWIFELNRSQCQIDRVPIYTNKNDIIYTVSTLLNVNIILFHAITHILIRSMPKCMLIIFLIRLYRSNGCTSMASCNLKINIVGYVGLSIDFLLHLIIKSKKFWRIQKLMQILRYSIYIALRSFPL